MTLRFLHCGNSKGNSSLHFTMSLMGLTRACSAHGNYGNQEGKKWGNIFQTLSVQFRMIFFQKTKKNLRGHPKMTSARGEGLGKSSRPNMGGRGLEPNVWGPFGAGSELLISDADVINRFFEFRKKNSFFWWIWNKSANKRCSRDIFRKTNRSLRSVQLYATIKSTEKKKKT